MVSQLTNKEQLIAYWGENLPIANIEVLGQLGIIDELAHIAHAWNSEDKIEYPNTVWLNATERDLDWPDRYARWQIHALQTNMYTYDREREKDLGDFPPKIFIEHTQETLRYTVGRGSIRGIQNEIGISQYPNYEDNSEQPDGAMSLPSVKFDLVEPTTIALIEIQEPTVRGWTRMGLYDFRDWEANEELEKMWKIFKQRDENLKRFNAMRIAGNAAPSKVLSLSIALAIFAKRGFTTVKSPSYMPVRDHMDFVKDDKQERFQEQLRRAMRQTAKRIDGIDMDEEQDEYGYWTLHLAPKLASPNPHLKNILDQI